MWAAFMWYIWHVLYELSRYLATNFKTHLTLKTMNQGCQLSTTSWSEIVYLFFVLVCFLVVLVVVLGGLWCIMLVEVSLSGRIPVFEISAFTPTQWRRTFLHISLWTISTVENTLLLYWALIWERYILNVLFQCCERYKLKFYSPAKLEQKNLTFYKSSQ